MTQLVCWIRSSTEYPQVEVVQVQLNCFDQDDLAVQSKACYDVCVKHQKSVIVMESVKGGSLASLPPDAMAVFSKLGEASPASYALRFAAGFSRVFMVVSRMTILVQPQENTAFMKGFKPLGRTELDAVRDVCAIHAGQGGHPVHRVPLLCCRLSCTHFGPRPFRLPKLQDDLSQLEC